MKVTYASDYLFYYHTYIQDIVIVAIRMKNTKFFGLLCLSIILLLGFVLPTYSGSATAAPENKTLMQPGGVQDMTTNATNIVLVHGLWADGSSWSKVIPILQNAGHRVIAVQLAAHSLADDVATVKRAIDLVGGPTILVGHSFGGFVITNAGYNNQNVTGLVYVSAFAPDEGESASEFRPCCITTSRIIGFR